ncbi:MAG: hypothetical protein WAK20_11685 [Candidatus Acidiferrum sp.]
MKRPFPVTFLGGLFVVAGITSLVYHVVTSPLDRWTVPISLVGVTAIVGGVFLIQGKRWARWLVLAWLALHVVVSAYHSFSDSAAHFVLLLAVGYFLLGEPSASYFKTSHPN